MEKQNRVMLINKRVALPLNIVQKLLPLALYLCCAALLKLHYSHATPDELQWILLPTALVVEMFTGIQFVFNALEGYCSIDNKIIIAPACAGVNFMIIIICLTASLTCKFKRMQKIQQFFVYLMAILFMSYSVTLLFNTIRIIIAIECYDAGIQWGYFTQERIHRLIGIVIYFAGICCVYLLAGKYLTEKDLNLKIEKYTMWLMPFFWYVTIMVVIPLVQGKQNNKSQLFFEHILFTAGVPLLITFLLVSSKKLFEHRRTNI